MQQCATGRAALHSAKLLLVEYSVRHGFHKRPCIDREVNGLDVIIFEILLFAYVPLEVRLAAFKSGLIMLRCTLLNLCRCRRFLTVLRAEVVNVIFGLVTQLATFSIARKRCSAVLHRALAIRRSSGVKSDRRLDFPGCQRSQPVPGAHVRRQLGDPRDADHVLQLHVDPFDQHWDQRLVLIQSASTTH